MLDPAVCRYVFALGISPRHKGFHYICGILSIMKEQEASSFRPGEIYPLLGITDEARRRSAERCMRYAVQYAWDTKGSGVCELFRCSGGCPPQLGDLICAAAWELADGSREGG